MKVPKIKMMMMMKELMDQYLKLAKKSVFKI
jgi:hypothetical protein